MLIEREGYDPEIVDYGYDGMSRLLSEVRTKAYDGMSRLLSETRKKAANGNLVYKYVWTYDLIGNRLTEERVDPKGTTSKTYTYNMIDGRRGDLLMAEVKDAPGTDNDATTTYTWDEEPVERESSPTSPAPSPAPRRP